MRFLAIDYGQRRIGLALSDPTGMLARAWKAIPRAGNPAQVVTVLAKEAQELMQEEDGLAGVVVGLPRRLGGEPTDLTAVVEDIAERLRHALPIPVILQDERLSSREAESRLAQNVKDWRRRKQQLDAASAAVILQDYLDHRTPDK